MKFQAQARAVRIYYKSVLARRLVENNFWGLIMLLGIVFLSCGALMGMAGFRLGDMLFAGIGLAIVVGRVLSDQ